MNNVKERIRTIKNTVLISVPPPEKSFDKNGLIQKPISYQKFNSMMWGNVIATGSEGIDEGARVSFQRGRGTEIELDGINYFVVFYKDILAIEQK